MGGHDARQRQVALLQIANRQHHVRAALGQHLGGVIAQTGVGSGDNGDAAPLVRYVGRAPFTVRTHRRKRYPLMIDAAVSQPGDDAGGNGPRRSRAIGWLQSVAWSVAFSMTWRTASRARWWRAWSIRHTRPVGARRCGGQSAA